MTMIIGIEFFKDLIENVVALPAKDEKAEPYDATTGTGWRFFELADSDLPKPYCAVKSLISACKSAREVAEAWDGIDPIATLEQLEAVGEQAGETLTEAEE